MSEARVRVFFYGSYMNPSVLREVDLAPEAFEVARLDGYDIRVAPRANLVPSSERCVYGVLAEATHAELNRLYTHAKDVLGETYVPHPVLVQTKEGAWVPALCYIAPAMVDRAPDPAYVDRILQPARALGFPEWYIRRLESERPFGA
ncbi:MAG TPA: gamma-glutamylcyclotransferase family protein [Vicinamibacteria bacterium]|nr:gamma-glutamylcyclotransferase family protein [Vicinamibacteria bacterium]